VAGGTRRRPAVRGRPAATDGRACRTTDERTDHGWGCDRARGRIVARDDDDDDDDDDVCDERTRANDDEVRTRVDDDAAMDDDDARPTSTTRDDEDGWWAREGIAIAGFRRVVRLAATGDAGCTDGGVERMWTRDRGEDGARDGATRRCAGMDGWWCAKEDAGDGGRATTNPKTTDVAATRRMFFVTRV